MKHLPLTKLIKDIEEDMTIREAIDQLELLQKEIEWDYPVDYSAAIKKAITRLEKEEGRAPSYEMGSWTCPVCGSQVEDTDNYCWFCGEALVHEDE